MLLFFTLIFTTCPGHSKTIPIELQPQQATTIQSELRAGDVVYLSFSKKVQVSAERLTFEEAELNNAFAYSATIPSAVTTAITVVNPNAEKVTGEYFDGSTAEDVVLSRLSEFPATVNIRQTFPVNVFLFGVNGPRKGTVAVWVRDVERNGTKVMLTEDASYPGNYAGGIEAPATAGKYTLMMQWEDRVSGKTGSIEHDFIVVKSVREVSSRTVSVEAVQNDWLLIANFTNKDGKADSLRWSYSNPDVPVDYQSYRLPVGATEASWHLWNRETKESRELTGGPTTGPAQ